MGGSSGGSGGAIGGPASSSTAGGAGKGGISSTTNKKHGKNETSAAAAGNTDAANSKKDDSSGTKVHDEKRRHIKSIIDRIPTQKEDLFNYKLDRNEIDNNLMERKIRPWINKKIIEYIGEPEPTLVDFICSKVLAGSSPQSILDDVQMVNNNFLKRQKFDLLGYIIVTLIINMAVRLFFAIFQIFKFV